MPVPITGQAIAAALTETFALTGKLALNLDQTVVPVITVGALDAALWSSPAIGFVSVGAGGAGNRSELEVSLPQQISGSGAAAIVDSVIVTSSANQTISVGASPGLAAPNVFGAAAWRDTTLRGQPVVLLNGKNNAAAVGAFATSLRVNILANTSYTIPLGWIIGDNPDTGLQQGLLIRPGVDNQTLVVSLQWRERVPR